MNPKVNLWKDQPDDLYDFKFNAKARTFAQAKEHAVGKHKGRLATADEVR